MSGEQNRHSLFVIVTDILKDPTSSWFIIAFTLVAAIGLWLLPQPPGVAIGLLAVVSVAMTVARATPIQKILLVGLSVAMFVLEARSIRLDREDQDQKAATQLTIQLEESRAENRTTLESAQENFSITQHKFAITESRLAKIFNENQKIGSVAAQNLKVTNNWRQHTNNRC